MMVRVAMDTVTDRASVSVALGDEIVDSQAVTGRRAARQLLPMIHAGLTRAGATVADIGELIVADGPGSFTGLRIGFATAIGLAAERSVAFRTVSSLAATAAGAAWCDGLTIAVMYDALRGEVFAAVYTLQPDGLRALAPPTLTTVAGLAATVTPDIVIGSGALAHRAAVEDWTGREPAAGTIHDADAANLLRTSALAPCVRTIEDPAAFEPSYGRKAEAQVRWEETHGRPLSDSHGPSR